MILYWASWVVSKLSIGQILRTLPSKFDTLGFARDTKTVKVVPWWQDLASAVPLLLTVPLVLTAKGTLLPAPLWISLAAIYLVFDAMIHPIRVLWFDDIAPKIGDARRAVWSHRRILFFSMLSYIQAILLFPAIYWLSPRLQGDGFHKLLVRSFKAATFTSIAEKLTLIDAAQVGVSLFFLAIVIATTASIAYQRNEVAQKLQDS